MNIFLPYEHNIFKSIKVLDDKRLVKQILECYQIYNISIKINNDNNIKIGYMNHPIVLHYKQYTNFVLWYAFVCCKEYNYRFCKLHKYTNYFNILCIKNNAIFDHIYIPFYMSGSKGQSNYIRTTKNVSKLFKNKLVNKWESDKVKPKWTNRSVPKFYKRKEV